MTGGFGGKAVKNVNPDAPQTHPDVDRGVEVSNLRYLALDVSQIIRGCWSDFQSLAIILPNLAVVCAVEAAIDKLLSLARSLPALITLFLVFDWGRNDAKGIQTDMRYGAVEESRVQAFNLIAHLRQAILPVPNESVDASQRRVAQIAALQSAAVQRLKEAGAKFPPQLIPFFFRRVREAMKNRVRVLFALTEADFMLATLFRFGIPFCSTDLDFISHGVIYWYTNLNTKNITKLVTENIFHRHMRSEDFKRILGPFAGFEKFGRLGFRLFHIATGSDYLRLGNRATMGVMGVVEAQKLVCDALKTVNTADARQAYQTIKPKIVEVFTTKAKQAEKPTVSMILDSALAQFDSPEEYHFVGEYDEFVKCLQSGTAMVAVGRKPSLYGLHELPPPSEADVAHTNRFYGQDLEDSELYKEVSAKDFCAATGFDQHFEDALLVLSKDHLILLGTSLGFECNVAEKRDEIAQQLRDFVKNEQHVLQPLLPRARILLWKQECASISGHELVQNLIENKNLNMWYCGTGSFGLETFFERAAVPNDEKATYVHRVLSYVLGGHMSFVDFDFFPAIDCDPGVATLIMLRCTKVIASMKSEEYCTIVCLAIDKEDGTISLVDKEGFSHCSCVAGLGKCSHQRAVALYFGLLIVACKTKSHDWIKAKFPKLVTEGRDMTIQFTVSGQRAPRSNVHVTHNAEPPSKADFYVDKNLLVAAWKVLSSEKSGPVEAGFPMAQSRGVDIDKSVEDDIAMRDLAGSKSLQEELRKNLAHVLKF